jgi:membrane-associated phospholipid phosphatase
MPKPILFIFSFSLFFLFIFFSYLVAKESFTKLDFDTTVRLQDHLSRKADLTFSIFSLIGSAEISMLFWLGLVFWSAIKRLWKTVLALMLLPLALLMEIFGKVFVYHPAPPHLFYRGVINFSLPSSYVPVEYSYPSGHLTRTAFIVTFLICYFTLRKNSFLATALCVIFLVTMFISRIYLGEHWLSDVIGGTLIGSSFGLIAGLSLSPKAH